MMLLAVLACLTQAPAQDTFDVTTVGKDPRWQIAGRTASVVDTNAKRALKLEFAPIMGLVWLKGYDFGNGVIEAYILGQSQPPHSSFVGVACRVIDWQNYHAGYFRHFH